MNKNGLVYLGVAGLCCIGGVCFIVLKLMGYAILCFTIAVVTAIMGVSSLVKNGNPTSRYENLVKDILNTFDSILVKSNSIPSLDGRNIVQVMSMDDLVDAQLEIRKPICYLKQTESCSFVLLDDKEAYVYVEKIRDDVVSPAEIAIKEANIKNKSKDSMDAEMLRDIEKTTVVKLSNQKSYKVSPIRKKKKEIETLEQDVKEEKKEEIKVNKKEKVIETLEEDDQIEVLEEKPISKKKNNVVVEVLDFDDDKFSKTEVLDEIEYL